MSPNRSSDSSDHTPATSSPSWDAPLLVPVDLDIAIRLFTDTLVPARDRDWSVPAGPLAMSCRDTLDHLANAFAYYAGQIAMRSPVRRIPIRDGEDAHPAAELLEIVETAATVIRVLAGATPPDARMYHRMGMADAEGFVAMTCVELLVHTWDIAQGLDLPFTPPADLPAKLLNRLFPWAPTGHDAWDTFLYSVGRSPLGDLPVQRDGTWGWHAAPRYEWDGSPSLTWAAVA